MIDQQHNSYMNGKQQVNLSINAKKYTNRTKVTKKNDWDTKKKDARGNYPFQQKHRNGQEKYIANH